MAIGPSHSNHSQGQQCAYSCRHAVTRSIDIIFARGGARYAQACTSQTGELLESNQCGY